ncbi:hypothetical protein TIFTF001_039141 [Ficus carica]|uniref:Uncharacterized protein n=1 Tax=Ficus carica TaxID=3494 RepID=A0AA88E8K8_FICCA|nr:hypothetical protein TIFTF001_039141 [Ficus carica]
MHDLVAELPGESVDEVQDPPRFAEGVIRMGGAVEERKVVDVDVEMDAIGEVVGGGEGAEAAGEGIEAVEGEDLDDEGEVAAEGETRVRVGVGVGDGGGEEEIGGAVVGEEEEEGGDGEEEEEGEEMALGTRHC